MLARALVQVALLGLAVSPAALPVGCAHRAAPPTPTRAAAATVQPTSVPPTRRPGPAAVGQEAPEFGLPALNGQTTRLSDYRGQVVLINFWATWCGPCQMEIPDLVSAYNRYHERGLVILAINQGEERDRVQAFASQHGMAFPVLLDPDGRMRGSYPTRFIPTSFVVDRQGVVRSIWIGTLDGGQLAKLVEPLLGGS